jgi:HD-GYP domain-containing protein (c-di-GMP phosphodiesterase class II)
VNEQQTPNPSVPSAGNSAPDPAPPPADAEVLDLLTPATAGFEAAAGALMRAFWLRDAETAAHSQRVAGYALRLCDVLGMRTNERRIIGLGALLHDLGKIGISDAILLKPAPLDSREWSEMRAHPVYGRRVLETFPDSEPVAQLVYHHHERLDGRGYPEGLQGNDLTMGVRVVSICDATDAMLTRRPYREALRPDQAVAELYRNAGTQFDADLVSLIVTMLAPDLARLQRDAG